MTMNRKDDDILGEAPYGDPLRRVFFNAQHSPIGAFQSFTLGAKGPCGGLGVELGGPAGEDVFAGVESEVEPGSYRALPFFASGLAGAGLQEFDPESLSGIGRQPRIHQFDEQEIERRFGAGIDAWTAGDLTFRLISPVKAVPDPDRVSPDELRFALVPAVLAELVVDNRRCDRARKAFFGYSGSNRTQAMRAWRADGLTGVGQGGAGIATNDPQAYAGVGFQPEALLDPFHERNLDFMLGRIGMIVGSAAPGQLASFRFAIGAFNGGDATTGLACRYLYSRCFSSLQDVLRFALERFDAFEARAEEFDARLRASLPPERALMLAHAIRSYYGSTQCLVREDGRPLWVVNEGEYRMMNTLDLMPDQAFMELSLNPWTVRSELDFYVERHGYEDRYGLAFSHDVGVANAFAAPGRSAYEQSGFSGCFSYMTCEELVNWVLCACLYALRTEDHAWLQQRSDVLQACLESLLNRDAPRADARDGVMSLDSDRCAGGSEITTYDSLDPSLGQARNNLYLAVKTWASYVLLNEAFRRLGREQSRSLAADRAALCARTVANSADDCGVLPALIGEEHPARIIPAIEGLAFVAFAGIADAQRFDGPYGDLLGALGRHLRAVLKESVCLFPDGGWRLSSTSKNSWLSKIYLCQFVAERVFGFEPDSCADSAHFEWLTRADNAYFAWSDQMVEGVAVGGRFYPRGVTAYLWLLDADGALPPRSGDESRRLSEVLG